MSEAAHRVIGIDPGLAATGYGVVAGDARNAEVLTYGVIRTRSPRPRSERLHAIHEQVGELIAEYRPDELAIEEPYVAANVRSAFAIGEARAAAMIAAAGHGIGVFQYGGSARIVPGGPAVIAALSGQLVRWDPERSTLWIDAGGVTYEVYMPAFAAEWAASHAEGETVQVFTYHHATERQPVPTLYGFTHLAEREFFRKFIDVPDMGPAKAVRALAHSISEIAGWIEAEDQRSLRQLPGIGERLSQTIIAHLHGKLVQEALLRDAVDADGAGPAADVRDDAVDALVALQYPRREAQRVVAAALTEEPALVTLEEVLRYVLERRGGGG